MVSIKINNQTFNKISIILSCCFLIILQCNSQEKEILKIAPETSVFNKISLSDIADDVFYIPLDNRFEFGIEPAIKITKNYIFLDSPEGIVRLNRDGKMAKKIGSIGRGPEEYLWSGSFTVDEKKNNIYVLDKNNLIKVFSENGNFFRSISLEAYGGYFQKNLEFYNSNLFVPEFNNMGRSKYNWIIIDTLGKLISKKENLLPSFSINLGNWGGVYKFERNIVYWDYYNDTIFSIFPDFKYKLRFLFATGDYRLPKIRLSPSQVTKFLLPLYLFETKRFLIFAYYYQKNTISLIDKKTQKIFLTFLSTQKDKKSYLDGISNDLDGGVSFQPQKYFNENGVEFLIEFLSPYILKAYVSSNEFKNSLAIFPDKKKELIKLADKLNDIDNPILMVIKLKYN